MYHGWNCCRNDHISTWFNMFFIIHIFLTSKQLCNCNRRRSSCKGQWEIIVCVARYITTIVQLRGYIVLINLFDIFNFFLGHNLYRFIFYNWKKGKFIFCFWEKLVSTIWLILFFNVSKVIVQVLLTTFYIISHFCFQSSDSKTTLLCHCILLPLQA